MNGLDWVFVVIVALMGIRCMAKGFTAEVLSMASIAVGLLAALMLYRPAGILFASWGMPTKPGSLPDISGFIVAFLAAFIAMKLVGRLVSEGVEASELGGLDRALGFLLGLAEGLLLVCVLLLAMSLLEPAMKAIPGYAKLLADSVFARIIIPIVGPEMAKAAQGLKAPELQLRPPQAAAPKP